MHWWERQPERLAVELAAFEARGWTCAIDQVARAAGRLVLNADVQLDGAAYSLRVAYPSSFPFFQPVVHNTGTPVGIRHEHPTEHTLCLLSDGGADWRPVTDRAADLIAAQLPTIVAINAAPMGAQTANEARQAEPYSAYLACAPFSHVAVPPLATFPLADARAKLNLYGKGSYRGVVASIKSLAGAQLVRTDLPSHAKPSLTLDVPVVALQERPSSHDADALWELAVRGLDTPPSFAPWPGETGAKLRAVALLYPDELQHGQMGNNFTLLIQHRSERRAADGQFNHVHVVRSEFESAEFRQQRVPELAGVRHKKVALFGVGALGSFVAMELARAGLGRLCILDTDILDAGNTVRWALGRHYAGYPKARALLEELAKAYPHTDVVAVNHRLGAPDALGSSEEALLDQMLDGADLVVDASASLAVNYFLSELAAQRRLPYVWLSTTNGAWGGMVGRVDPATPGCGLCHRYLLNQPGGIPLPAAKPGEPEIQPAGCLDPTFTGTAFDSSEVALQAVRLVMATLCRGEANGYPDYVWNLATVDLRTPDGSLTVPTWSTFVVTPQACCRAAVD